MTATSVEEAVLKRLARDTSASLAAAIWRDLGTIAPDPRSSVIARVESRLMELDEAVHLPLGRQAEEAVQQATFDLIAAHARARRENLAMLLRGRTDTLTSTESAHEKMALLRALREDASTTCVRVLADTLRANVEPRHEITVFELDLTTPIDTSNDVLHLKLVADEDVKTSCTLAWSCIYGIYGLNDDASTNAHLWLNDDVATSAHLWLLDAPLAVLIALNRPEGFPPFHVGVDLSTEH